MNFLKIMYGQTATEEGRPEVQLVVGVCTIDKPVSCIKRKLYNHHE